MVFVLETYVVQQRPGAKLAFSFGGSLWASCHNADLEKDGAPHGWTESRLEEDGELGGRVRAVRFIPLVAAAVWGEAEPGNWEKSRFQTGLRGGLT